MVQLTHCWLPLWRIILLKQNKTKQNKTKQNKTKQNKTKQKSNKELIGQGISNTLAGMICGLPGAGATMRTVLFLTVFVNLLQAVAVGMVLAAFFFGKLG